MLVTSQSLGMLVIFSAYAELMLVVLVQLVVILTLMLLLANESRMCSACPKHMPS